MYRYWGQSRSTNDLCHKNERVSDSDRVSFLHSYIVSIVYGLHFYLTKNPTNDLLVDNLACQEPNKRFIESLVANKLFVGFFA